MRTLSTSYVLGFHGCDKAVAEKVLSGAPLKPSQNDYDWLGPGIYFWEANPRRGLDFAIELKGVKRAKIAEPAVIGAVIDLGLCLDLTTGAGIAQVARAHRSLVQVAAESGWDLPTNGEDLRRRDLDCAVFRMLHDIRKNEGDPALETVRGIFVEGRPLYAGGGIFEKTHIQLCVCNPANIKGVFRVGKEFLT